MTENTPTKSAVAQLAASLAADLDDELRAAITRRLGRSTWTHEELAGRLQYRDDPSDDDCRTYFLDGAALLGVKPAGYDELGAAHLGTNRSMVAGLEFLRYSPKAAAT